MKHTFLENPRDVNRSADPVLRVWACGLLPFDALFLKDSASAHLEFLFYIYIYRSLSGNRANSITPDPRLALPLDILVSAHNF